MNVFSSYETTCDYVCKEGTKINFEIFADIVKLYE